jgi:co-chaperonin GroES (HSP10)
LEMTQSLQVLARTIAENPNVLEPLGSYIAVELYKPAEKSIGGIHLSTATVDKSNRVLGRVVSVGPGHRSILTGEYMACTVKPGDLVLITKHAANAIILEGATVHIVAEGDIVAVVNEELLQPLVEEAEKKIEEAQTAELPEGAVVEQECEEATVSELPSGLFLVSKKTEAV